MEILLLTIVRAIIHHEIIFTFKNIKNKWKKIAMSRGRLMAFHMFFIVISLMERAHTHTNTHTLTQ